jgi:hypothetical protein
MKKTFVDFLFLTTAMRYNTPVYFHDGRAEQQVRINGIAREDGSGQRWNITTDAGASIYWSETLNPQKFYIKG